MIPYLSKQSEVLKILSGVIISGIEPPIMYVLVYLASLLSMLAVVEVDSPRVIVSAFLSMWFL